MFTTLNIAHKCMIRRSTKCSQLVKMFTTGENAHNSRKCSQHLRMPTTGENAHKLKNAHSMLTTYKMRMHNIIYTIFEIAYDTPNRYDHKSCICPQRRIKPPALS